MITFPVGLFFLSSHGYFDPFYKVFGGVPSPESRPLVSGVFAVLGVNLVVAGFIITAFKEDTPKAGKQD